MERMASRTWLRIGVLGFVAVLALLTFLFLRGPSVWQRQYYPLQHQDLIEDSAVRHQVSPFLVAAVIQAESSWDAAAKSGAGAVGLMQILPSTAKELARRGTVDVDEFPVEDLDEPAVNIEYGTAYLRYLVERYHEIETALAAYNAGLANVDTWTEEGGDIREQIEFPETKHFVLKVSRGKDRYEALYPDAFPKWSEQ